LEDILQTEYIYIYMAAFNIFQRMMDYLKPEVLITPATLQIRSPEKQMNTTLNPLGILMLLWLDGGLSTATELTPSNTKETSESLWQEKDLTIRLCAATMLQLKPRTKAHTEHILFVRPYASTEISYSP